jgi:hypothetical protein
LLFGTAYFSFMSAKNLLYERDFYALSRQQAELLRAGKLAEAADASAAPGSPRRFAPRDDDSA